MLTVVIPTYNRPDYLAESLASVARQTLPEFRLVVLDNASELDNSGALAAAGSRPVEYVRNPFNVGNTNIGKAMKEYSDGQFLVVFHDDDVMHPRMLELEMEVLQSDPEVQFVATEYVWFRDGESPPVEAFEAPVQPAEVFDDAAALVRALLGGADLCFGSAAYRSSVLHEIEADLGRFGSYTDRPFLLDAARHGKCALLRGPLVLYRVHPGQDTLTGGLEIENLIELLKEYRDVLPQPLDEADQHLFYGYAASFLATNYLRLPKDRRHGAVALFRACRKAGVLRLKDTDLGWWATLLRADGLGWLIDPLVGFKRVLGRRR